MSETELMALVERARAIAKHITPVGRRRTASMAQKRAVLARTGGACAGCGSGKNVRVHHRTPVSKGGTNAPGNLVAFCEFCERRDHARFRI